MKIAVYGLGYVGSVTAACLAAAGHTVLGIDVNRSKVDQILSGLSPVLEPGLDEMINDCVQKGRLTGTDDPASVLEDSDVAMICVGTPQQSNGELDLQYVERVCKEIALSLRVHKGRLVVVIRSTILPGASEGLISILESDSGLECGDEFGFCINPEFLREGTALKDFRNPPFTVVAASDEASSSVVAELFQAVNAPIFNVPFGVSEMVKYSSNAFHALKVVFANEIGDICREYGVDSHLVLDIFNRDDRLNLSPRYLRPGFAFGGSCLPKDLRALLYDAKRNDLDSPVLGAILPSNQMQIDRALGMVRDQPGKRVALLGLSFKTLTDDLRESPAVELAERLIGKGFELSIYDRDVSLGRIHGSNREFIDKAIPHLGQRITDSIKEAVESADTIVVTKQLSPNEASTLTNLIKADQTIIDLARSDHINPDSVEGEYVGIAW